MITVLDCRVVIRGSLILIYRESFIFNGLVQVFDGESQNIEKELS